MKLWVRDLCHCSLGAELENVLVEMVPVEKMNTKAVKKTVLSPCKYSGEPELIPAVLCSFSPPLGNRLD